MKTESTTKYTFQLSPMYKLKKKLRTDNSEIWLQLLPKLRSSLVEDVLNLYFVWCGLYSRCNRPKSPSYAQYGGRGIELCQQWAESPKGALRFMKWALSRGWRHGLVIDRKNNNKGYSPLNCHVTTYQVNARNTRRTKILKVGHERKCESAWATDSRCVVSAGRFRQRIHRGWSVERALLTPKRDVRGKLYLYKGVKKSLREWADFLGVRYFTLWKRMKVNTQSFKQTLEYYATKKGIVI